MKRIIKFAFLALIAASIISCGKDDKKKGGEPAEESDLELRKDWTAEIVSVGTDEDGDYVQLEVSAPGSTNLGITILTDADYKELYSSSPAKVAEAFASAIKKDLAEADIMDITWRANEDIYLDYNVAGPGYCWIIDFDAEGNLTGKYGRVAVDVPELKEEKVPGELAGEVALQSNWKVTSVGEPYSYQSYDLVDIEVEAPGATYIWCDSYTDDELAGYYPGGISEMLLDYSSSNKTDLAENPDDTMADLCFAPDEEGMYIMYYGAGETKVYIMDFNASGAATGKYGVTTITLPEYEGEGGTGAVSAPKLGRMRVHKAPAARHLRRAKI